MKLVKPLLFCAYVFSQLFSYSSWAGAYEKELLKLLKHEEVVTFFQENTAIERLIRSLTGEDYYLPEKVFHALLAEKKLKPITDTIFRGIKKTVHEYEKKNQGLDDSALFQKLCKKELRPQELLRNYYGIVKKHHLYFMDAYPIESFVRGPLEERLQAFVKKWPKNVRIVDDVEFSFSYDETTPIVSRKKLLVISTAELGKNRNRFIEDYLTHFADETLSFPTGTGANHLYSRIGTKVVDGYGSLTTDTYRLPSDERIEPFIRLTPTEQLRLRKYLFHAQTDFEKTVGQSGYDGVKTGKTRSMLNDNRPCSHSLRHNCTSWITTAPIGKSGENLYTLLGIKPKMEVFTNPGWWNYYLTGAAAQARVPFIAYWSPDSLPTTLTKIKRGLFQNWDFNAH